jgi:hypothetical protein
MFDPLTLEMMGYSGERLDTPALGRADQLTVAAKLGGMGGLPG